MYICIYIYIYTYKYIFVPKYIYIYICICTCTYEHTYLYKSIENAKVQEGGHEAHVKNGGKDFSSTDDIGAKRKHAQSSEIKSGGKDQAVTRELREKEKCGVGMDARKTLGTYQRNAKGGEGGGAAARGGGGGGGRNLEVERERAEVDAPTRPRSHDVDAARQSGGVADSEIYQVFWMPFSLLAAVVN